ncbi:MAG: DsbA family oxidoreductase, partial [Asticcacaulis sp.]|nr:DsbA family oxidoreductase [Asticcacaulis sp.]
ETFNVRGVPFVVIDRKVAVSGAQGTANFVKALMTAEPNPVTDGDVCGIDGCDPA